MTKTSELVGTWHLHRWSALKNGEQDGFPMGADARGQIIYAQGGYMTAFLMRADFADRNEPATVDNCLSYGGSWSITSDSVSHQVTFSSLAHWIGRPLVRRLSRRGDDLILHTAPEHSKSGNRYEHELVWRRVRRD